MPSCKVLVLTNFPEGNWERSGDEKKAAQSLAESLQAVLGRAGWRSPIISKHNNFKELLTNAATDGECEYVLFLSSLHVVDSAKIEEALKRALFLRSDVVLFPSHVKRVSEEAEFIRDLLYQETPRLVNCKLPNNTPLRMPGLMIRRDILVSFVNYLAGSKRATKTYQLLTSSDGVAITLRLFLRENHIDVHLSDGPVFQMRDRCEDMYALPTIRRRIMFNRIHRCLGNGLLRRKKPAERTNPPLHKRIRMESVKKAISRLMHPAPAIPWQNLVDLPLSQGQALKLLESADQSKPFPLGVLAWEARF
jgi:hypothetical protein